jgi:hypothetical protein
MFNDDAGYYFCLDCDSGEVVRYDNDDPEPRLAYHGLVPMLQTVLAGYDEGIYSWDPEEGIVSDTALEWDLARRMNPGIAYWEGAWIR